MTELKWQWVYYPYLDAPTKQEESALKAGYIKVVMKEDVDKVIAKKDELIASLQDINKVLAHNGVRLNKMLNEKDKEIEELKAKLESVQASMYADVVDANMENRRLKRALWIARAERAKTEHLSKIMYSTLFRDFIEKWVNVERKCRAKAEEYK